MEEKGYGVIWTISRLIHRFTEYNKKNFSQDGRLSGQCFIKNNNIDQIIRKTNQKMDVLCKIS
jgi:hypothetical protein